MVNIIKFLIRIVQQTITQTREATATNFPPQYIYFLYFLSFKAVFQLGLLLPDTRKLSIVFQDNSPAVDCTRHQIQWSIFLSNILLNAIYQYISCIRAWQSWPTFLNLTRKQNAKPWRQHPTQPASPFPPHPPEETGDR